MLQLPNNEAGPPPTTATYVDNADCAMCHSALNTSWSSTPHARAYPDLVSGFNLPTCKPCHTTGAGVPEIFPATGYNVTTNLPAYLQNVTCQSCHGPGSEHIVAGNATQARAMIGLVMNASLCGSCHFAEEGLSGLHHPTYNEWQVSGHNESDLPSYIKNNVACANCHEAWLAMKFLETGQTSTVMRQPDEDAPITWEIACATCHDPHSTGQSGFQLRVPVEQICAKCHNAGDTNQVGMTPHHPMAEMRNDTAGYITDRTGLDYMPTVYCSQCHMGTTQAGLPNHTFMPNPTACLACHNSTGLLPNITSADQAELIIDAVKTITQSEQATVSPVLDQAKAVIAEMAGNRTTQNLADWRLEYARALFNQQTVELDMSSGNHNPLLAEALLNDSLARSQDIVSHLTPPDKISGVAAVVETGKLNITWHASTALDFTKYRIYVLTTDEKNITSQTATLEIDSKSTVYAVIGDLKGGTTYYVYVTAVDADGNEITNTLTSVSATLPKSSSLMTYALIGVILAIVIIAIVAVLLMRRKKGASPSETPTSPPDKT